VAVKGFRNLGTGLRRGSKERSFGPRPEGHLRLAESDVNPGEAGLAEDGTLDVFGGRLCLLEARLLGNTPIHTRSGQNGSLSPALAKPMASTELHVKLREVRYTPMAPLGVP